MRFSFKIAYHGGSYEGWQSQLSGKGVQDAIERVLAKIAKSPIRLHGAGRTDAGVHALGQVAHFDAPPESKLDAKLWWAAANAYLPPSIRVLEVRRVEESFHARFDAIGKRYRYWLLGGELLNPMDADRVWHVRGGFDPEKLRSALQIFLGTHDFRSFAVRQCEEGKSTVRTVTGVELRQEGDKWSIDFLGDGFLHKMVRMMTASAVKVACGKLGERELLHFLENPRGGSHCYVAPAQGLFLCDVFYAKTPVSFKVEMDERAEGVCHGDRGSH